MVPPSVPPSDFARYDNIERVPPELPDTLTAKEAEAWDLYQRGMSQRSIAVMLDLTRAAVRDRLERAAVKIARAERELAK